MRRHRLTLTSSKQYQYIFSDLPEIKVWNSKSCFLQYPETSKKYVFRRENRGTFPSYQNSFTKYRHFSNFEKLSHSKISFEISLTHFSYLPKRILSTLKPTNKSTTS